MRQHSWGILLWPLIALGPDGGGAGAADAPSPALSQVQEQPATPPDRPIRQRRGQAIEGLIQSSGDAALQRFAQEQLAPQYRDSFGPRELTKFLESIRSACSGFAGVLYERVGDDGLRIRFMRDAGEAQLMFRLERDPPQRIIALELGASAPRANRPALAPISWETLPQRLQAEAEHGFAGTVLAVHNGQIALHQGYGLANRERAIANSTQTIFAIGSVPIDFTKAAILKLAEQSKLATSDPITKYLSSVPADKQTITLDQLMTGRSGLPNFHGIAGVDADPDLSWIDRDTAIRRILGQELQFAPGAGEAHSHSAWVLLAAIVELVAKQPYPEFLRQQFFLPASMTRTGQHEEGARFADDEFAVGYGHEAHGALNIPKDWGKTSWLVMGSGGMYSTPEDLYRWLQAIRTGKTLSATSAARYFTDGVLAGGDDRGFFCLYTQGPRDLFILCSNVHTGPGDLTSQVGEALVQLVRGGPGAPPSKYTLGVELDADAGGGVRIRRVVPGGAAEAAGLQAGDVLLTAQGKALRDPVQPTLQALLQTGEPIPFEIERSGQRQTIQVTPLARR